jgi:hypothetical protein
MTPEASTIKLNDLLRTIAISNKEEWSQDVAIKISTLDGLKYKYQEESERFHSDNDLLKQYIKPRIPS